MIRLEYLFLLLILLFAGCNSKSELLIQSHEIEATFNTNGDLQSLKHKGKRFNIDASVNNKLDSCQVESIEIKKKTKSQIKIIKNLQHSSGRAKIVLVENYIIHNSGLLCRIEITDEGNNWSTPITTSLRYPANALTKFWTAWADPRGSEIEARPDNVLIANAIIPEDNVGGNWSDPLIAMPLRKAKWFYGAPDYQYNDPGLVYCPFQGDVVCIPMASFLDEDINQGLSIVLSHKDLILDMHMNTTEDGEVSFRRYNHRLGMGRTISFTYDIILHEADWRSAMAWTVNRYSDYYNPNLAHADTVVGTAAYSNHYVDFDVDKMKKMAFKVNWRASFDFPYMGQFLPPVKTGEKWNSFLRARHVGIRKTWKASIPDMEKYCQVMNSYGFNVLNYFNVTEFGTQIQFPAPPQKAKKEEDLWKDPNDFLYGKLSEAILYVPDRQIAVLDIGQYSVRPGDPFWTWERAVAMDPAEPVYQDHLIKQAQRHVLEIPSASGICIDRMDWLRFYNHNRDDGVSWFGNQAVRSLNVSWNDLMSKLDTVFHNHDKLIYVNNHTKRIEHLKYVDGILDEFTYAGAPLNTIALMTVNKPCMGWMSNDKQLLPDPDAVIQKYLYMGVFPMAPYPGNDHSMQPSALADSVYLDYGPLFQLMTGKKWILEPNVLQVTDNAAKANIYKTFAGLTIPVVYGGSTETVEIKVKKSGLSDKNLQVTALFPGEEEPVPVTWRFEDEVLKIQAPLKRGCAMLNITQDI